MIPKMRIRKLEVSTGRAALNTIIEKSTYGITPVRMLLDDREVDVLCELVDIDDETTEVRAVAIVVNDNLEARLAEIPEPEGPT